MLRLPMWRALRAVGALGVLLLRLMGSHTASLAGESSVQNSDFRFRGSGECEAALAAAGCVPPYNVASCSVCVDRHQHQLRAAGCSAAAVQAWCAAQANTIACDIAVAGGSTASLAAALTAAEADPTLSVCFTDWTDWPGGQMTSGGVPAIDFGGLNEHSANQPASFRSAMESIPGDGAAFDPVSHEGSGSPGACSVSSKCYRPNVLVDDWIVPRLEKAKNLRVFLRTVITNSTRGPNGILTELHAVQRSVVPGAAEWSMRLSDELPDWYTPTDSAIFTKRKLIIRAQVFIDATELGDVLATSGSRLAQGIEYPFENSTTFEHCGQSQTLTFFMELLDSPAPAPTPTRQQPPWGSDEGRAFDGSKGSKWVLDKDHGWLHSWTWRRSFDPTGNRSLYSVNVGDISQQNTGNDLDTAYLFLPLPIVVAEAHNGWRGGLNRTALRMLEDRAYGWFWNMRNISSHLDTSYPERLSLSYTTAGTRHGLSKVPYFRDTRRAFGIDGWRLMHEPLRDTYGPAGTQFEDTVALGDYDDDIHHLKNGSSAAFKINCDYSNLGGPESRGEGAKPYYIPLRALLVGDTRNLLVAGKTMSQSFHANSNTRLHPSEWTSGVAAGGTAVMMARNGWTSTDALMHVRQVQNFLNSSAVGQPLQWTGLPPATLPVGWVCELDRCLHVGESGADATRGKVYNTSTCGNQCNPLAGDEWLASDADWLPWHTAEDNIRATLATSLKKSTVPAQQLPPSRTRSVAAGTLCRKLAATTFDDHFLCTPEVNFTTGYGSACELGRCFPVGAAAAAQAKESRHLSARSNCSGVAACSNTHGLVSPLADDEWLAVVSDWTRNPTHPFDINANKRTFLLKVAADPSGLPPQQKLLVQPGFLCKLGGDGQQFAGYFLCSHRGSHPPSYV